MHVFIKFCACVCFLLFLQNEANKILSSCQINKTYFNFLPSSKNMYAILFFYFGEYFPSRDEGFIFDSHVRVLLVFYSRTYFQNIKYKSMFDLSIFRQKIVWVAWIFKNIKLTHKNSNNKNFKSFDLDPSS